MKIILFVLVLTQLALTCELKQQVVSLSAPFTTILSELNLLSSEKLVAVSSFHYIPKEIEKKKLEGGIFLAKKELQQYKNSFFVFDQSNELEENLENAGIRQKYQIVTRDLTPQDVIHQNLKVIQMLTKNCDAEVVKFKNQISELEKAINTHEKKKFLFFVGECKEKLPELIMANDGFVKFLLETNKLQTYPSDLSYVSWSSKVMKKLADFQKICLHSKNIDETNLEIIKSEEYWQIYDARALEPGWSQLKFLNEFYQKI